MLTEDWDAALLLTAFQPADILFVLCGWGRAACSLGSAEGDWCVLALHLSLLSPPSWVHRYIGLIQSIFMLLSQS